MTKKCPKLYVLRQLLNFFSFQEGGSGGGGGGFHSPMDIFDMFFGGDPFGRGRARQGPRRTKNLVHQLSVNLEVRALHYCEENFTFHGGEYRYRYGMILLSRCDLFKIIRPRLCGVFRCRNTVIHVKNYRYRYFLKCRY
jgi:hypothetical protein